MDIKIEGVLEAPDVKSIEEFLDRFITLIEAQGWYCGASFSEYVTDEEEDRRTVEKFRRLQRNCKLARDLLDKVGWVCSIFEVHEYPEIEATPVVDELRKLLKELTTSDMVLALSVADATLSRKLGS